MPAKAHPAKFSGPIMEALTELLADEDRFPGPILDQFAGTGRIHELGRDDTIGIELEAEWAAHHHRTKTGNALDLYGYPAGTICTSPTYGNRMADQYDGRDGSRRHTYRLDLGRPLSAHSSAAMQWGANYREFHLDAWIEAVRALTPGGAFILNISDHIRAGRRQYVAGWHVSVLTRLGLDVEEWRKVQTARQRHGANGDLRVDAEDLIILRKAPK